MYLEGRWYGLRLATGLGAAQREQHAEAGALARPTVDLDRASVPAHDAQHGGQAEAAPLEPPTEPRPGLEPAASQERVRGEVDRTGDLATDDDAVRTRLLEMLPHLKGSCMAYL